MSRPMPKPLSPYEKRAATRAKRKNNAIARKYPLLAHTKTIDDWLTTLEAEAKAIDRVSANHEAWREQQWLKNEADKLRASMLRRVCCHLFLAEEIAADDAFLDKHFSHGFRAYRYCDHWQCKIRDFYKKPIPEPSWQDIKQFYDTYYPQKGF